MLRCLFESNRCVSAEFVEDVKFAWTGVFQAETIDLVLAIRLVNDVQRQIDDDWVPFQVAVTVEDLEVDHFFSS